jgi:hypothetical protein
MKGMGKEISNPAPRLEGEASGLIHPPAPSRAPSWRVRIGLHLWGWAYIYALLALALYSSSILRARLQKNLYDDTQNGSQVSDRGEYWTEWLDVCNVAQLGTYLCGVTDRSLVNRSYQVRN